MQVFKKLRIKNNISILFFFSYMLASLAEERGLDRGCFHKIVDALNGGTTFSHLKNI